MNSDMVKVDGGWVHRAALRVEEHDGSWTTQVLVNLHSQYVSLDDVPGWPSIAGIDPIVQTPEFRASCRLMRAPGLEQQRRMLVTFTLTEEGYEVRPAAFYLEGEGLEPACEIATWFMANEEGLDVDTMLEVLNLKPGQSYEGGGGAAAEWKVTRRA